MKFLDKVIEIAKVNIKTSLSYIVAAWGAFFVTTLQIFIFYYIWMSIYGAKPLLVGVSKEQIISYIIISRILYTQITWSFIYSIGQKIYTGAIAMDFLRPVDFQLATYIGRMGDLLAFGAMTAIPAFIIVSLALGFFIPHSLVTIGAFLFSILLALTIAFFVEFTIGIMAFYTTNSWGLQILYEALISFLSGAIIPIMFFPSWFKTIIEALPFKDMVYTPIAIYLGLIKGSAVVDAILFQAAWVVGLFVLSRTVFYFATKKITVQGG